MKNVAACIWKMWLLVFETRGCLYLKNKGCIWNEHIVLLRLGSKHNGDEST